ncbi:MAG TPA: MIP/aquaporin family protein [Kiritimatiellia bacterium]|nr:MIP/aquaporin family protein [Kiritimatiellia bacterium]
MRFRREVLGEALGTCLLVLFGCGSVAVSVLFGAHQGLLPVALVWGVGVTLAIYLTRHLSCAHLNPAVTLAMAASGRMVWRKVPAYVVSQFAGAFLAGLLLYLLFAPSIAAFEARHSIVRGSAESVATAKMFGEFYPDPGGAARVTLPLAMGAEALGTFLLVLMIFALTEGCNVGRPNDALAPVFIGLTVTSAICLIAPLTQAGLNPARDLGPRLVAWLAGWGGAAFPDRAGGFFHVYVLAPIVGGIAAARFFVGVLEPAMRQAPDGCGCKGGDCSR